MNVLSLFDGMSCGQIALERAGFKVDKYFASEIDKYAIKVTQANYPETIQLGDVRNVKADDLPSIDLLIGGSPCQGFSFAGKQLNFDDPRSKLFFEFVRLFKETKPKYFLLENVRMKKEYQDVISKLLGVDPVMINSCLVSAQNRKRFYWTNIPNVTQPEDKGILLKDILLNEYAEPKQLKKYFNEKKNIVSYDRCIQIGEADLKGHDYIKRVYSPEGKSPTLNANGGGNLEPKVSVIENHNSKDGLMCVGGLIKNKKWLDDGGNLQRNYSQGERIYSAKGKNPTLNAHSGGTAGVGNNLITETGNPLFWRKLTPTECERLQTVPDKYTLVPWGNRMMSNSQRYKMLGNGWTVDVICHILKNMSI